MATLGDWDPLRPDEVPVVLDKLDSWWCLSGGWALDLLVGNPTRTHGDTDVTVLRADAQRVRRHFGDWDLHVADPPGAGTLRPWPVGTELAANLHDVWCRRTNSDPWCLQLMINDVHFGDWIYRRDQRIRRPLGTLSGRASTSAMRVLTPEVQLLFKSNVPRMKDQADFRTVLPHMAPQERQWLVDSLRVTAPTHAWIADLST